MDKGEEELARDALRRKKSFSDNALMLKKQLDQHTRATSQLSTNIKYGSMHVMLYSCQLDMLKHLELQLCGLLLTVMYDMCSSSILSVCT